MCNVNINGKIQSRLLYEGGSQLAETADDRSLLIRRKLFEQICVIGIALGLRGRFPHSVGEMSAGQRGTGSSASPLTSGALVNSNL